MTIAAKKDGLIAKILDNDTYMTNSGLYERTAAGLRKLSYDELVGLDLIVSLKEQFAANNPAKWVGFRVAFTVDVSDRDYREALLERAREIGFDHDDPTERQLLQRLFRECGQHPLNECPVRE